MKNAILISWVFSLMFVGTVSATIINVPADQPNIQAGIDASSNGDTVRVEPGTYFERINFSGKNIVVGSWFLDDGDTSYISSTIIEGNQSGSVVYFGNGEDNAAIIIGFTIQNGSDSYGGGIHCDNSSPTISYNHITGNTTAVSGAGAGIACRNYANPVISFNTIYENSSPSANGGGIYCWNLSMPWITNNTITGNSSNYGGGIYSNNSSPIVLNSIFWGNSANISGDEIYVNGPATPNFNYCDIQGGWTGSGNIDCDPAFCDAPSNNYYLTTGSCCYGTGDGGVNIGALGRGCGANITINVPADFSTIQEAIDASIDRDTVLVQPGTYYENINFNGKNVILGSLYFTTEDTSYISSTIIDGSESGPVVTFVNGEDNTAIIIGFTIQNGSSPYGGGIYCYESYPTISNNTISGNSASYHGGGGIYCLDSYPTISNNTISGNSARGYGGGIYCNYSGPTITNNTISGNSASYHGGGGIYCLDSYLNPTISNNTISGNSGHYGGGGISCYYSSPVITNTIFWADSAPTGPEIHLIGPSSPVITYCDVQGGWAGDGNIDCDPMFCDPENGNYYLDANSCCVGAGEGGVDIGAFGVGCGDIGYEYLPGDVNMALGIWPPTVIGGDVTYLVGYFIGGGQESCLLDGFWCSADINGDCVIIGGDVTALVGYFVAGGALVPCPDYESAWLESIPDVQPAGWPNCETPVINSRVIPTGSIK